MFSVCLYLISGQKSELDERQSDMENLQFVNACGDLYTKIPDYFVPEIEEANS